MTELWGNPIALVLVGKLIVLVIFAIIVLAIIIYWVYKGR